jgi:HEAT repeat protein/cyclophilin family peptidyl-prolyl cis-trans isomerase
MLALVASACASAPPAPPVTPRPAPPAPPPFEEKMSWILRLEDQRILRDPPRETAPAPPVPVRDQNMPDVAPPPPDLLRLLGDEEARTRRRAALAVGRVGLREGVPPLVALLSDSDPEVRQMAAFSLGLLGDRSARDPLVAALDDPAPLVKGSAAEALGLLGDAAAADAIARMASQIVESGALADPPGDAEDARRDTPAAAFRLALYALVRLKAYGPLASTVLGPDGEPRVRWWPVAYALQRIEDPRALPALLALARDPHPYTRAFAVKGLGPLRNRSAVPALLPLVTSPDRVVAIEAMRSLGRIGDPAAAPSLLKIVQTPKGDPDLRFEAVSALGGVGGRGASAVPGVIDALLDTLADASPPIRAAAIRSLAQVDADGFVTVLSGLDPDPSWTVRAALATVLGTLAPEAGLPRLKSMLGDTDSRVIPAVLASLAHVHAPDAPAVMLDRLGNDDPVIRAAAANALGELKPPEGAAALAAAYRFGQRDLSYVARAAAIGALAAYGAADAVPVLSDALADKDWAVRVRAAALLKGLDPASDADVRIRPAPTAYPADLYRAPRLVAPPVSTQIYLEMDRGLIQIELAVLDAPLTVENFISLARKKFFDGLTFHRVVPGFVVQGGDPRSDGEGGPGYTIRDELNERPYVRGTVGMALDWADTGGSQFFITGSPQPQLDDRYTIFGRVIDGMEIVDQIHQGDVIRRVIVWDGETLK